MVRRRPRDVTGVLPKRSIARDSGLFEDVLYEFPTGEVAAAVVPAAMEEYVDSAVRSMIEHGVPAAERAARGLHWPTAKQLAAQIRIFRNIAGNLRGRDANYDNDPLWAERQPPLHHDAVEVLQLCDAVERYRREGHAEATGYFAINLGMAFQRMMLRSLERHAKSSRDKLAGRSLGAKATADIVAAKLEPRRAWMREQWNKRRPKFNSDRACAEHLGRLYLTARTVKVGPDSILRDVRRKK